jgi:hypothetical protein
MFEQSAFVVIPGGCLLTIVRAVHLKDTNFLCSKEEDYVLHRLYAPAVMLAASFFSVTTWASTIPAGLITWDVNFPGNAGQFDIANETGVNASVLPDTTFPISTKLTFSGLGLVVHFANGSTNTYGSSYFTLGADGQSFDGTPIPIGGTNPLPTSATLTGLFSPLSITLTNGTTTPILASFTATITPSGGTTLADGDLAIINATTGVVGGTPEPGTWALMGIGLGCATVFRRKRTLASCRSFFTQSGGPAAKGMLVMSVLLMAQLAVAQVNLNTWTSPDSGTAGINNVNVLGSSFPTTGTITPANVVVTFATSCGGASLATTNATSVKTVIGSSKRVNVAIPGSLATGTYFVTVTDSTGGDATFTSNNCSAVNVTHTNSTLSACLPTSSLGVLAPLSAGKVTAYVPQGNWGGGSTGIQAVDIELGSSKTAISTPNIVNSCSSNPATGQSVCVANNTDVYLISGTTLTNTLTSGSTSIASFSGGSCENCGVAINPLTNKAVIAMGLSANANGGVQLLDLNTNTFSPPVVQTSGEVSEDISVDPTRNFILSAGEGGVYTLFQIQADNTTLKEFAPTFNTGLVNDTSGEDCSTGIAVSSGEGSNTVFLMDLTQIALGASTYTAPNTTATLVTSYFFSAGLSATTIAPGTSHLGVTTGEFGGNTFAVIKLPSTGGTGTPTLVDYAVANIPTSATCGTWSAGFDPHTVTAYTSPNDGKAYALFTNAGASCVARVDLAAVLAATRGGSGLSAHDVSNANFPAAAATFYLTH